MSEEDVFKMYYKDVCQICIYDTFWTSARCLACLAKTSLRHFIDVFLPTDIKKQSLLSQEWMKLQHWNVD